MKICKKCGENKRLSEFYTIRANRDGRFGKCKMCVLEDRKIYRNNNQDTLREYEKSRTPLKKKARRENPEKYREAARRKYAANAAHYYEMSKRWRSKNKEKVNARNSLYRAIKRGEIQRQPCIVCGDKRSHGHHEDYSKPLDVIWLCSHHHSQVHCGEIIVL